MNINLLVTRQTFLVSTTITVFLNGVEAAWAGNGEKITISAPNGENEILLKANMRSKKIKFAAEKDINITVKWNRLSGKMDCLCTGEDIKIL